MKNFYYTPNDSHSIAELWVGTVDGNEAVEEGWITSPWHPHPQLFVYHWINGKGTCYSYDNVNYGCGFVKVKTPIPVGSDLKVGSTGRLRINCDCAGKNSGNKGRWYVSYNGNVIGYFPTSLWNNEFTTISSLQVYGEIAASSTDPAHTQMGNGLLGTNQHADSFSGLQLINSMRGNPDLLGNYYEPKNYNIYSFGHKHATSFNFGGPGY